jgi:hypothetical protein
VYIKLFSGEFVSAETGEEETFHAKTTAEVRTMLLNMKDGDALVLNCRAEEFKGPRI